MPLSGKAMVDALVLRAQAVIGQPLTKGNWTVTIAEARSLQGPLYFPIPLTPGAKAAAFRLTLVIDGIEKITPSYVKEVVDGVPILDDWWCVLMAHEIPDMNNNAQLEYIKERLLAFAEMEPI
jgi:hypothetical protein